MVKAFGQKSKSNKNRRSLAYESGENAYMLIYRERNEGNVNRVGDELINQDLRQDIELDFDLEKIQQIEREQKA